jgi:hypothetical protein
MFGRKPSEGPDLDRAHEPKAMPGYGCQQSKSECFGPLSFDYRARLSQSVQDKILVVYARAWGHSLVAFLPGASSTRNLSGVDVVLQVSARGVADRSHLTIFVVGSVALPPAPAPASGAAPPASGAAASGVAAAPPASGAVVFAGSWSNERWFTALKCPAAV